MKILNPLFTGPLSEGLSFHLVQLRFVPVCPGRETGSAWGEAGASQRIFVERLPGCHAAQRVHQCAIIIRQSDPRIRNIKFPELMNSRIAIGTRPAGGGYLDTRTMASRIAY
eukprot:SAG31_NODE_5371_length_2580_cov_3.768239_1_plen_112_part_00